ncbi:MAG TPA: hypothetical protein VGG07_25100 [Solirubrobacteraceae bacterium]|jgi:hypothetical protein
MDTHECPAPGCGERVSFERFACKRHWYAVPGPLRAELLYEYRRNFGDQGYLDARQRCVDALVDRR